MEIMKIVNRLKSCNYQCEAGPLEKNPAFIELEKAAQKNPESEPSTSINTPKATIALCIDKFQELAGKGVESFSTGEIIEMLEEIAQQ